MKMQSRNRYPWLNQDKLQPTKERLSKIYDRIRNHKRECLIPCKLGEKHDDPNNCHIISQHRLGLIADPNGKVLLWPSSIQSISELVLNEAMAGESKARRLFPNSTLIDLQQYPPMCASKNSRKKSQDHCTQKFACKYHDNNAFILADKPVTEFDPHDDKTQFALGLRSIAAYTDLYRIHTRYARHDFHRDPDMRQIKREYPVKARRMIWELQKLGQSQTFITRQIELEMSYWRKAYLECDLSKVVSCVITAHPALRLAGTGIHPCNEYSVVITILPADQHQCTIIATAIERPSLPECRSAVSQEAQEIKEILENGKPSYGLEKLAGDFWWEFLYASPDDYQNLPEEDSIRVAKSFARKFREWRENLPAG